MQTIILIILLAITSSTFAQTYGPTKAGDLLWNIAGKVRPNKSITRYQSMLALLKANPQAFQIPCNLNTLRIGKILQIPLNMQELTKKEAVNEFYRQHNEWKDFRNKQIICESTKEQSILEIPTVKLNTEIKITSTETFETIIPEKSIPIQANNIKTAIISQVQSNEIESFTLIQSIWHDIETWFYSLAYIHQILFLVLTTLVSISLLLLLFASIFRNKKTIDKEQSINTAEKDVSPMESDNKSAELPKKSDKMKDKLDTVRAYLAEDEDNRIQKLLRDVIQSGTDEQRVEAQQLYEINKKMSYLKLTDTQTINTNLHSIEQIPDELPLAKNEDQVFGLIDKVFLMLDEELNAQGKLIDSYIARQQEVVSSNVTNYENSYQVVEDENSLKRPDLKPTRRL
ncbi:MAG: FimV/HubP family polar landmark protein [Candidatus Marithrix sp.]